MTNKMKTDKIIVNFSISLLFYPVSDKISNLEILKKTIKL